MLKSGDGYLKSKNGYLTLKITLKENIPHFHEMKAPFLQHTIFQRHTNQRDPTGFFLLSDCPSKNTETFSKHEMEFCFWIIRISLYD